LERFPTRKHTVRSHRARKAPVPMPSSPEVSNPRQRNSLQTKAFLRVERTGIEPVTSGLQIPDNSVRLGQIRSIKAKLRWLREVEIGYSGTRFGTRFCASAPVARRCISVIVAKMESGASSGVAPHTRELLDRVRRVPWLRYRIFVCGPSVSVTTRLRGTWAGMRAQTSGAVKPRLGAGPRSSPHWRVCRTRPGPSARAGALDLLVHDPTDAWRWLPARCSPTSSSEPGLGRGGSG
jgi:hypothetical protein